MPNPENALCPGLEDISATNGYPVGSDAYAPRVARASANVG